MKKNQKGGTMSEFQPNIYNLFSILIFMGPYIIISFFVILFIFSLNMKGIFYLFGVIILVTIAKLFSKSVNEDNIPNQQLSAMCQLFGNKMVLSGASLNSGIYSYTFSYLFTSMITYNIMNIPLIAMLLSFYVFDAMFNLNYGCVLPQHILFITILGFIIGFFMSYFAKTFGLGYYSEYVSDKLACTMPKKQHYKCKMYHKGELVDDLSFSGGKFSSDSSS